MNERLIILETLLLMDKGEGGNDVIRLVLDKYSYLDKQERSFIKRVIEGTIERRIELDYIINCYSKTKVNKMKPVIRTIMRMSVYQLKYMDSVPESAVCNEAVKLANKKGFSTLKGFVNGVLRNIARNLSQIEYPQEDTPEGMSIKYSCPEWLVKQLIKEQGMELAKVMLEDALDEKPLYIRVNQSQISVKELTKKLEAENIRYSKAPYIPYALKLSDIDSVNMISAFDKGYFQVQDVSSMLVCELAGIREGDTVIDVCAAPGGKTIHALDILNGSGQMYSYDVSDNKVELIVDNAVRCNMYSEEMTNLTVEVKDALEYDESLEQIADVLIADLPCSGIGVMGRKNDIKYNISADKEADLVELQREILKNVSRYVKPGGTMMFSTCTVHKAENEDNVKWIEANLPFKHVSIKDILPAGINSDTAEAGYAQLIQGREKSDGFFVSKFVRIEDL